MHIEYPHIELLLLLLKLFKERDESETWVGALYCIVLPFWFLLVRWLACVEACQTKSGSMLCQGFVFNPVSV